MYNYEEKIDRIKECYTISKDTTGIQIDSTCIEHATQVAELLKSLDIEIQAVNPSSFNAIMFEFELAEKYVMIECYNDGGVCVLERKKGYGHSEIVLYKYEDLKEKLVELFKT